MAIPLVTSNEFSVSIVPQVPTSTYTYNVAQDSVSWGWRYQSLGQLTDETKFVLRGTGDHGPYQDNSIRLFNAVTLTTTTLEAYGAVGNRSPFHQYDNHPTPLLPAAFTGTDDTLFWPSSGVYRLGSVNNWTHCRSKIRAGTEGYPVASISATNPAIVTFTTVSDAGKFDVASGSPAVGMYFYHPGCNKHDQLFLSVQNNEPANTFVTVPGLDGSTVTGFQAGVGLATPIAPYTTSVADIFDGPHVNEYIKDETQDQRYMGFGSAGNIPYNAAQAYWPNGNKYIFIHGGAGSYGPQTLRPLQLIEANPAYPASESWPFHIIDWPFALQNTGPAAWEVRTNIRNQCAVIGDWFYLAGGGTGTDSVRVNNYKFHRIRLTDGWVQRLRDLPAAITITMLCALSYDSKRHRLLWTSDKAYAFDVDSIVDINSQGDPWVDLFPGGVYPTGAYHGLDGHDCKYVRSLDKHFIRNGREVVLGEGAPNNRWSTLQLPTAWIRE